jgi:hypothetical protein
MWLFPVLLFAFAAYLLLAATCCPQWRGHWANRNAWRTGRESVPMSVAGHATFGLSLLWWAIVMSIRPAGWWLNVAGSVWILLFVLTMLVGIRDYRSYRQASQDHLSR